MMVKILCKPEDKQWYLFHEPGCNDVFVLVSPIEPITGETMIPWTERLRKEGKIYRIENAMVIDIHTIGDWVKNLLGGKDERNNTPTNTDAFGCHG